MARIAPKFTNQIFTEEDKLSGEMLKFVYRRKQAKRIINNVKEDTNELNNILEALKYDNTNKTCI